MVQECLAAARSHHHLPPESLDYKESIASGRQASVLGDLEELKTAVSNLIDNAIKYSGSQVRVLGGSGRDRTPSTWRSASGIKGSAFRRSELKRIFKRFYRIPGTVARRVNGTGSGPVYRSLGREKTRRPRLCGERGHGPRQHVHASASGRVDS